MASIHTRDNVNHGIQIGQNNASVTMNIGSLETAEQACIQALRVTNPRDDKNRIKETKGGLLEESYRWILENDEFKQWQNNQTNCLLWVKGDPGKGKTMLLCGIIEELTRSNVTDANISFFFCQASDAQINNATAVLRGLIFLLVDQSPSLLSHVQTQYDKAGKALFEGPNAWSALSAIFRDILRDPSLKPTYLIIDALDECTVGRHFLLDMIAQESSSHSRVKWIVSSRNWPDIEERLGTASCIARVSLELNDSCVLEAVNSFIRHKVALLANAKGYPERTREIIYQHLVSNSQGTFLWVALVCHNLDRTRPRHAINKLEAFPPGLGSLYDRMINQLYQSEDAILCKQILAVMSTVYRPVTLDELNTLIEEPCGDDLAEIIADCGSFLTLQKGVGASEHTTVTFVHQSAKDFLLKGPQEVQDEVIPGGVRAENYRILTQSFKVMFKTLRRDIFGIKLPGFPIDLVKPPSPNPLAGAHYACVYWVDHLADTDHGEFPEDVPRTDVERCLDVFLRQKYLYWLEALSLLRQISSGVLAVQRLGMIIKESDYSQELSDRARDALRFFQYFKAPIENTPLQVYHSPLIFSPERSLTKIAFQNERPSWILNNPVVEQDWGLCVQILEGHINPVDWVSWSPDGSKLASTAGDETIWIWDSTTGQIAQILETPGIENCIATWSPDGNFLASVSHDTKIRTWDMTAFQIAKILEGPDVEVVNPVPWLPNGRQLAWSPNGSQLASTFADGRIIIWGSATGQIIRILENDTRTMSVAWSPDGNRLVSGCSDTTIRIWDLTTFQNVQILREHSAWVDSVAWSSDGSQFASESHDGTIIIWSSDAVQNMRIQKSGNDMPFFVASISWSPDGRRLASKSIGSPTVEVWDTATGQSLHVLEGHTNAVNSFSWSPDGHRLASASRDRMIRIWDLASPQRLSNPKKRGSDMISTVILSPDGVQLASVAHRPKTLTIWDVATGERTRTFEVVDNLISYATWSPDGSPLIAATEGTRRIIIWDIVTGQTFSTFEGHNVSIGLITWSPDASRLALSFNEKTVGIWDPAATCLNMQVLEGHSGMIDSIVWSPDGSRIASASDDTTVRIWEPAVTSKSVQVLEGNGQSFTSVAWSLDGSRLASASGKTIRIWNSETGQNLYFFDMGDSLGLSVTWSLDGSRLAASVRNTVMIWETATAECVSTCHINSPQFLEFDNIHRNHLHTSVGTYDIGSRGSTGALAPQRIGYGLDDDRSWITYGGDNILWLPPGYRPHWNQECHFVTTEGHIAISDPSGGIVFLAVKDIEQSASGPRY